MPLVTGHTIISEYVWIPECIIQENSFVYDYFIRISISIDEIMKYS